MSRQGAIHILQAIISTAGACRTLFTNRLCQTSSVSVLFREIGYDALLAPRAEHWMWL